MTVRWSLQPDVPDEAPTVVALLLELQGATSIHDAHELAVDAVKAGATGEQVSQAITGWISLQAQQVQTVVSTPRCVCSHTPKSHTVGTGRCWSLSCCCDSFQDKEDQ